MTARDAEELAQKLWGSDTRIGRVRRGRSKSPRFKVGYVDISGGGMWLGTSNVDWEAAFVNATAVAP